MSNFSFTGRSQLADYQGAFVGGRLEADRSREGVIDDGNRAWPERVVEARRQWPEAQAEDFEQLDKRGRLFRDRATGVEYRRVRGAPLLDLSSPSSAAISCFFVRGQEPGELIVLKPADHKEATSYYIGHFGGSKVTGVVAQNSEIF